MSQILETDWKRALTSIIEDLKTEQYNKLLHQLTKVPQMKKKAEREEMPQIIIEHYGVRDSISVINDAMDRIPRKDAVVQDLLQPFVDKLRQEHKGKKRKREPEKEEKKSSAAKKRKHGNKAVKAKSGRNAGKKKNKNVPGPVKRTKSRAAGQQTNCSNGEAGERKEADKTGSQVRIPPPWKKTIIDLNTSGQLLDTDAINVKVVGKSVLREYKTKAEVEKPFFYLAVADETACTKVMVYGSERYKQLLEEKFYLFRKIKWDDAVKVHKQSKVSETAGFDVPPEIEQEAQNLLDRPVRSIADIIELVDEVVSVEGTVTEINGVEKAKKKKRQDIQLKDKTGSIRICFWGAATRQCVGISINDVIRAKNVKIKRFFEDVSLNSTGSTRIQKVQSVGVQKRRIQIMGVIKAGKRITQLEADVGGMLHAFTVSTRLLAEEFDLESDSDIKNELLKLLPQSADAEIRGNKISKVTAVQ